MTYTSIKIKRRKTTLRGKPVSLFVQLICHRQTRRIPLDIRICEEEWNPHEEKLQIPADTGSSRNSYLLKGNEMLLKVRHKIGLLIMQLEKQGDYSVDDLLVAYQAQNRPHTLSGYIEYRAKNLRNRKKQPPLIIVEACVTVSPVFSARKKRSRKTSRYKLSTSR